MNDKIRVGLIGYGSGGRIFHAPFLSTVADFQVIKIRATKAESIRFAKERFPEAKIVSDETDIFSDPEVDLIVITVPNQFHYSLTKKALENGKHVLVDKPFTITVSEADELIKLSKLKGKLLTVYQNRRWDSDFKTIQKIIDAKLLGNLVEYEAHFDRFRNYVAPNTWKETTSPGTGILYDLGAHLIDQALVLFGLPEKVHAHLAVQREGAVITDNFQLTLYYPKLRVLLKAGMLAREPGIRYILSGDQGSFVKSGIDVQEEFLKAGKGPDEIANWGEEPESIWGKINTSYNGFDWLGKIRSEKGSYSEFYSRLAKAIKQEAEVPVRPEEARNVIKIIELAIQSDKHGKVLNMNDE